MSDIRIVHARMEELESEVAEQRTALEAHLAEYKTKHHTYVMNPSSTAELQTEVEELEAKLLQVRHLVEYLWECPESALALMTPGSVADDLDKILDPDCDSLDVACVSECAACDLPFCAECMEDGMCETCTDREFMDAVDAVGAEVENG